MLATVRALTYKTVRRTMNWELFQNSLTAFNHQTPELIVAAQLPVPKFVLWISGRKEEEEIGPLRSTKPRSHSEVELCLIARVFSETI